MKFVFVTDGTWGDILPFVEVAKELQQKGAKVILCTNEYYREFMIEQGLEFVQTTPKSLREEMLSEPNLWKPFKSMFTSPKYIGQIFEHTYPILDSITQTGDMVIAHSFAFAAPTLAQLKDIRFVSLLISPIQVRSKYELPIIFKNTNPNKWPSFLKKKFWNVGDFFIDMLCPQNINIFLKKNNLPKIKAFLDYGISKELSIGLWSDWYTPLQPDQMHVRLVGFPQGVVISKKIDDELLEWVKSGDKPIVVTMGSGYFFNKKLVKIIKNVSQKTGKRFIVIVQEDECIDSKNILFRKKINLENILPQCTLFIHHGGAGSVAQALCSGVPSLVVSMAYDQPDNGYRIQKNKLGDWISESDISASLLIKKINQILNNKIILNSVEHASPKIGAENGIKGAVDVLINIKKLD